MEESNYSDRLRNIGRNDPCPCGSGKKYKKCHLIKDEETKHKEMKRQEEKMKAGKKDDKENEEEVDNKKDHKVTHSNFKNLPKPKMTKRDRLTNAPRRSAI